MFDSLSYVAINVIGDRIDKIRLICNQNSRSDQPASITTSIRSNQYNQDHLWLMNLKRKYNFPAKELKNKMTILMHSPTRSLPLPSYFSSLSSPSFSEVFVSLQLCIHASLILIKFTWSGLDSRLTH